MSKISASESIMRMYKGSGEHLVACGALDQLIYLVEDEVDQPTLLAIEAARDKVSTIIHAISKEESLKV